jgi:hypothetical protein
MLHDVHSLAPLAPLMLGQIPAVSAGEVGQWLFCGACVVVIVNYAFQLFKNLTGGFQRKPSAPTDGSPSTSECTARHAAIEAKFSAMQNEWKKDRQDLHTRINTIAEGVAFIRGKFEDKRKP